MGTCKSGRCLNGKRISAVINAEKELLTSNLYAFPSAQFSSEEICDWWALIYKNSFSKSQSHGRRETLSISVRDWMNVWGGPAVQNEAFTSFFYSWKRKQRLYWVFLEQRRRSLFHARPHHHHGYHGYHQKGKFLILKSRNLVVKWLILQFCDLWFQKKAKIFAIRMSYFTNRTFLW